MTLLSLPYDFFFQDEVSFHYVADLVHSSLGACQDIEILRSPLSFNVLQCQPWILANLQINAYQVSCE